MKILSGSFIYDFKVVNAAASSANDSDIYTDEFIVDFQFRKLNADIDVRRSLQIPRTSQQIAPIMADLLGEYEVPAPAKSELAEHFKFYLERLNRVRRGGGGVIKVAVTLEVEAISSGRAEAIQSRMEAGRRESENSRVVRRVADTAAETKPAKKSAVEALKRWWFEGGDEVEERECAICLEAFAKNVEVMKMPCSHLYHKDCIIRWLDKNHFCPFCRFELPC